MAVVIAALVTATVAAMEAVKGIAKWVGERRQEDLWSGGRVVLGEVS